MRKEIEKDTFKVINECIEKKKEAFAWYLFNNHTIKTPVKIDSFNLEKEEIHFSPSPGSVKELSQIIGGIGKINIYIPNFSFVFCSELKKYDESGKFILKAPEMSLFYDRRETNRVDLEISIMAKFIHKGKTFRKKLFDIGPGGCSIIFSKTERFKVNIGEVISDLTLEVTDSKNSILINAKVASILKLSPYLLDNTPYGGNRISFQFTGLKSVETDFINKIILSHVGMAKK